MAAATQAGLFPTAAELTQGVLFVIQDLHSIREHCETDLTRYIPIRDRLLKDDEWQKKYFDDDLNPLDPGHANWKALLFGGHRQAQIEVLGNWYASMPTCADRLESQLKWIEPDIEHLGENGRNAIETFLSRRQLPQRWRGFMPRAWEVPVAVDVARRVATALRNSFEALPDDWRADDVQDADCRETIRRCVGSAIHGAELDLRIIGTEAELKILEGEVSRDLAELKTATGFGNPPYAESRSSPLVEPEIAPPSADAVADGQWSVPVANQPPIDPHNLTENEIAVLEVLASGPLQRLPLYQSAISSIAKTVPAKFDKGTLEPMRHKGLIVKGKPGRDSKGIELSPHGREVARRLSESKKQNLPQY